MSSQRLVRSSKQDIDAALDSLAREMGRHRHLQEYRPLGGIQALDECRTLVTLSFACTKRPLRTWTKVLLSVALAALAVALGRWLHLEAQPADTLADLPWMLFFQGLMSNLLVILPMLVLGLALLRIDGTSRKEENGLADLESRFWAGLVGPNNRPPVLVTRWPSTPKWIMHVQVVLSAAAFAAFGYSVGFSAAAVFLLVVFGPAILSAVIESTPMSAVSSWKYKGLSSLRFLNGLFWIPSAAIVLVSACVQVLSVPLGAPLAHSRQLQTPLDGVLEEYVGEAGFWVWAILFLAMLYLTWSNRRAMLKELRAQRQILGDMRREYAHIVRELRTLSGLGLLPVDLTRVQRTVLLANWLMFTLATWILLGVDIWCAVSYLGARVAPALFPRGPIFSSEGVVLFMSLSGMVLLYILVRHWLRAYSLATYPRRLLQRQGENRVPEELSMRVRSLCQKASIPVPQILLKDDRHINAQIFGRTPWNSRCVLELTRGSVVELEGDELDALIAHEIGHIKRERGLWVLTILSALSMGGVSFLNALTDYAEREFAADEFAAKRLDSGDGLIRLIARLDRQAAAAPASATAKNRKVQSEGEALQEEWAEMLESYFHNQLPYYYHPTAQDRIMNITAVVAGAT